MRKAVLVVSFGTTYWESCQKNIAAVEQAVKEKMNLPIYRAFTSETVRRVLEQRGTKVNDVPCALMQLHEDGIDEVTVLPTHLLFGREYDKMCSQLEAGRDRFFKVRVALPLLAGEEDMRRVLHTLSRNNPTDDDEALVLMGHGTDHFCNTVYAAMDFQAKAQGLLHVFVGTVEAFPDLELTLKQVQAAGYRKALLTPLMLVAGDHAVNDMASHQPKSWRSRFEKAGLSVRTRISGLGEYPSIRELYVAHAVAAE